MCKTEAELAAKLAKNPNVKKPAALAHWLIKTGKVKLK